MRVITGTIRGRKLKEPVGMAIRPTSDMVKESVFNIIQFIVEGSRVLDLFAGTGQMGIEALSRGAREAVFVDASQDSIKLVRENIKIAGFEDRSRVVATDSLMYLKSGEKFDIVYIDPPYATDLLEKALDLASKFDILNENGIILCESAREKDIPDLSRPGFTRREYRYGRIKITAFTKNSSQEEK